MAIGSLRASILAMEVGERLEVSANTTSGNTVRGYASDLGFDAGRKYSVNRDRERRIYIITRHS